VKVINLSLGGPKDEIMSTIFKLLKKPIVLVTAAGNSGPKALTSFPGVIAVIASNANNQIYRHANQGNYIDIAATGEDIWVPITNSGQYVSGTSFSAALASGVIGKLISVHATTNTEGIKQLT
jgi:subtilisin family serine protease